MKVSACTIIKNAFNGYCLFEAMASLLPYVDEMIVLDMGSTDGTWTILQNIATENSKVRTHQRKYPWHSATELADAQTKVVNTCEHDKILFFQADEVWHEDLLILLPDIFENEESPDVGFWRVQLKENFQEMKWVPHIVHRIGTKNSLVFEGNSMNPIGFEQPPTFPVHPLNLYQDRLEWSREEWEYIHPYGFDFSTFILDISKNGAFLENIPERSRDHAPLWNEQPNVDGIEIDEWLDMQSANDNWIETRSNFEIPKILEYHIGKSSYILREKLLAALIENTTEKFLYD